MDTAKSPIVSAWRAASIQPWKACTDHEFIRGIGDGSLPTATINALINKQPKAASE